MKRTAVFVWGLLFVCNPVLAQESAEEAYTRVITQRADRIVDAMEFAGGEERINVRDLIVDFYLNLSTTHDSRDAKIEKLKGLSGDFSDEISALENEARKDVTQIRLSFIADLSEILSREQIDQVKDGLTYQIATNTYNTYCEMIPSLSNEQKSRIWNWLVEARDSAMVGGSSEEKHGWFRKYKGKINNFLSQQGYNLKEEERKWAERREKKN